MTALDSFRNPPVENLEISVEPQIFNFAAQPVRADFVANNGYFNNLSIIGNPAGTQNNSLTTNFITPTSNPAYGGDYHLGIYGIADGSSNSAVVFDLFQNILNPGRGPQNGEQFTKLSICSTPPNGPFLITTNYSISGGIVTGILVAPSGVLQLGSNTTARWDIQTSSGNLVPSQGQSVEVGWQSNPLIRVHAFEFDVYNYSLALVGYLRWNNGASRVELSTGPTAGFITTNSMQLNSACTQFSGVGPPSAATGINGDLFWRSDGAAGTTLYVKRAGAWVAATGV